MRRASSGWWRTWWARVLAESGAVAQAGPVPEPAPGPEASPHHLLAMLDELSEEELDHLLSAQL
jgi:hypothetical protein